MFACWDFRGNFRHGEGENRSPPRLSWCHPIKTRCHIDGDDDADDGRGGAHDDAGRRRVVHDCGATACGTKHFDGRWKLKKIEPVHTLGYLSFVTRLKWASETWIPRTLP